MRDSNRQLYPLIRRHSHRPTIHFQHFLQVPQGTLEEGQMHVQCNRFITFIAISKPYFLGPVWLDLRYAILLPVKMGPEKHFIRITGQKVPKKKGPYTPSKLS